VSALEFDFATAQRIRFGRGVADEVAPDLAARFRRIFIVTGRRRDRAAWLVQALSAAGVEVFPYSARGEPTVAQVEDAVAAALASDCEAVVSVGGGSAIDMGKAIAALMTNAGAPLDYLEVIGAGRPLTQPAMPFVAIPTTAGTGAEVTRNAVLKSTAHGVKVSLRSPRMLPWRAIVDPALTDSLPPDITAATGLDALTQVLEPLVSRRATPITDALCREALPRAARALRRAHADGGDTEARDDMAMVSLFGGLALANSGLGAIHGFAGPAGGLCDAPHGALCARMMPLVMDANVRALAGHPSLERYREVAVLLTGRADARPEDGVEWAHALCADLGVPGLATYGLTEAQLPGLVAAAERSSSMRGNPVDLPTDVLLTLAWRAL
jgi:alcohol dehydrogenase class IV